MSIRTAFLFVFFLAVTSCKNSRDDVKKVCDCYDKINSISDLLEREKYCVKAHIDLASKYVDDPDKAREIDSVIDNSKKHMLERISSNK